MNEYVKAAANSSSDMMFSAQDSKMQLKQAATKRRHRRPLSSVEFEGIFGIVTTFSSSFSPNQ